MLVADETKTRRIIRVYKILKQILKRYGKSVSFPKKTDPSKTYSWRFLAKFVDEFDKLELSDDALKGVLEAVVDDAKRRGLLNCGVAVLSKVDLLAAFNRKLEREVEDEKQTTIDIERSHRFILRKLDEERVKDKHLTLLALLSKRTHPRAYANITRWSQSGELSTGYIAVSKICRKALRSLDEHELNLYPTLLQFKCIRLRIISHQNVVVKLRDLLGGDLFEE